MNVGVLLSYVGWAIVYTAAAIAVLGGAGRAVGLFVTGRLWTTLFVILFFVVLTQHPFPDPATLVCPVSKARPNLVPMQFMESWVRQWSRHDTVAGFLREGQVLSVVMNLLLCGLIGVMLWRHLIRLRAAMLLGFGLSLGVELTQLTGIWGLYPCAFRKFDVDDLLLNTLGVLLGFLAARQLVRP